MAAVMKRVHRRDAEDADFYIILCALCASAVNISDAAVNLTLTRN
jgi:hypothetical protein